MKKSRLISTQLTAKALAAIGVLLLTVNCGLWTAFAQQPTSTSALFEVNSHYVGGRTWADYKASAGSGLTLNLAAGTAVCGNPPARVVYAGGTLTMTNANTNYVFLNPAASLPPGLEHHGVHRRHDPHGPGGGGRRSDYRRDRCAHLVR